MNEQPPAHERNPGKYPPPLPLLADTITDRTRLTSASEPDNKRPPTAPSPGLTSAHRPPPTYPRTKHPELALTGPNAHDQKRGGSGESGMRTVTRTEDGGPRYAPHHTHCPEMQTPTHMPGTSHPRQNPGTRHIKRPKPERAPPSAGEQRKRRANGENENGAG